MTLSAPPEQMLREPLDPPGDPPSRRVARVAGIFMVITFISIPALPLYDQVLHHTNFIVGAGGDTRVYVGALFEILTLIAGIGMAVTLYPVLKRHSESLALSYVTVRVVESCLIAVGIVSLLAVVTLRKDLAGAAGTDHASLILSGRALVAVHDAPFLLGPYAQTSGASFVLTLPEAVWELSLGIYLIVKGFRPSSILYDDGVRAGVD